MMMINKIKRSFAVLFIVFCISGLWLGISNLWWFIDMMQFQDFISKIWISLAGIFIVSILIIYIIDMIKNEDTK